MFYCLVIPPFLNLIAILPESSLNIFILTFYEHSVNLRRYRQLNIMAPHSTVGNQQKTRNMNAMNIVKNWKIDLKEFSSKFVVYSRRNMLRLRRVIGKRRKMCSYLVSLVLFLQIRCHSNVKNKQPVVQD